MKMPGGERAIVPEDKLRRYCLSFDHSRGKAKADGFLRCLGLSAADSPELAIELKRAAAVEDAVQGRAHPFGTVWVIDFVMERRGRRAPIRSIWMIEPVSEVPRLLTCFVNLRSED